MAFFDDLSSLCARELSVAVRTKDYARKSEMISNLATMLGRSIARVCEGDAKAIDTLLAGTENHVASEASDFSQWIKLMDGIRARKAP